MEYFLEQIKLILPVMVLSFCFLLLLQIVTNDNSLESKVKNEAHETYFIKTKTFEASMIETDQDYIVAKGSEAKKSNVKLMY